MNNVIDFINTNRDRYVDELRLLADQCRTVGLLPSPSRTA